MEAVMTRDELKSIIKECYFEIKADNQPINESDDEDRKEEIERKMHDIGVYFNRVYKSVVSNDKKGREYTDEEKEEFKNCMGKEKLEYDRLKKELDEINDK